MLQLKIAELTALSDPLEVDQIARHSFTSSDSSSCTGSRDWAGQIKPFASGEKELSPDRSKEVQVSL